MNSTLHKLLGSMIVLALLIFTAEAAFLSCPTWLDVDPDPEPEAWLGINWLTEPDEPEAWLDIAPLTEPDEPEDSPDPEEPEFIDGEPDEPELSPFDEDPEPTEPEIA